MRDKSNQTVAHYAKSEHREAGRRGLDARAMRLRDQVLTRLVKYGFGEVRIINHSGQCQRANHRGQHEERFLLGCCGGLAFELAFDGVHEF